ncbi:hypothetical protein CH298_12390 [Rhodococcoides fascians]|uniref:hypothetical protein n=1 Tax=Rhodococcoides fascians TaxID=1828 RepID=UPI000B9AD65E|nr:hypothetical protein [Rhodococcus fascians]MBY3792692.1 hypothetical protein [Rhodococcus fascians]MBY3825332.1 hypothetical protein [Rhodococcus fascians]MBY3835793.1 hypothetical protein [Rhodococcus fascians]MBY3865005.1 hypothetical protein [Rhodococcus fascians]MBY3884593.1 hypothetical protein [Rhodococcus fascians]
MKRKIATGLLGLIVATSVAGCGDDASTENASTTSVQATSAQAAPATTTQATTAAATPTADAPADSPAPEAPPAADPADPAVTGGTGGVTGDDLYRQTCTQFLPSIDALEQTGISDRAKSVEGLRSEMTTAPSWSTVPEADQGEILRGLDAAGAGQC